MIGKSEKGSKAAARGSALHTPGPWKIHGRYGENKTEIGNGSRAVATVWTKVGRPVPENERRRRREGARATVYVDEPEGVANAKLIEQAPVLADALAECARQMVMEASEIGSDDYHEAIRIADAALKAAGRLP